MLLKRASLCTAAPHHVLPRFSAPQELKQSTELVDHHYPSFAMGFAMVRRSVVAVVGCKAPITKSAPVVTYTLASSVLIRICSARFLDQRLSQIEEVKSDSTMMVAIMGRTMTSYS